MAKVTKKEMFNRLLTLEPIQNDPTLVEFITRELTLLKDKAERAAKRLTPTQRGNEILKQKIVEYLTASGESLTISTMLKTIPDLADLSSQKVNALLIQLQTAGVVQRSVDKRKAYFSAVVEQREEG